MVRLANGNTVLTNWCPGRLGSRKAEWPKTIQLVEVTPDKKVVRVLREWTDPDLGTSSCVQMLDEPAEDEEQELTSKRTALFDGKTRFDEHQWHRVELLVNARDGTARMAVAQPVGTKAIEVLQFKDPTAGKVGPIA